MYSASFSPSSKNSSSSLDDDALAQAQSINSERAFPFILELAVEYGPRK
jgi:hypothetical protein